MYPGPGMFPVMPDRVSRARRVRRPGPAAQGAPVEGHRRTGATAPSRRPRNCATNYRRLMRRLHPLIGKGLAAAVYTQTTDVEVEVNGLPDLRPRGDQVRRRPRRRSGTRPCSARRRRTASWSPTSEKAGQKWRYTTDEAGRRLGEAGLRRRASGRRARAGSARRMTPGTRRSDRVEDARHLAPPRRSS